MSRRSSVEDTSIFSSFRELFASAFSDGCFLVSFANVAQLPVRLACSILTLFNTKPCCSHGSTLADNAPEENERSEILDTDQEPGARLSKLTPPSTPERIRRTRKKRQIAIAVGYNCAHDSEGRPVVITRSRDSSCRSKSPMN